MTDMWRVTHPDSPDTVLVGYHDITTESREEHQYLRVTKDRSIYAPEIAGWVWEKIAPPPPAELTELSSVVRVNGTIFMRCMRVDARPWHCEYNSYASWKELLAKGIPMVPDTWKELK